METLIFLREKKCQEAALLVQRKFSACLFHSVSQFQAATAVWATFLLLALDRFLDFFFFHISDAYQKSRRL